MACVLFAQEMLSMSVAEHSALLTPDDLLAMPDGDRFELVDGHLVERYMGFLSSVIGATVIGLIRAYLQECNSGWVAGSDCGYQCFPDEPHKVRKPDVSFIALSRLPQEAMPTGFVRIAPDLAVEVISPNDLDVETDQKVEDYLHAGVKLVWVINPQSRTVLVYRADGSIVGLRDSDELTGETVLPGFRCGVSELFALPSQPAR
jgi:Uma2 family endonuclease